MCAGIDLRVWDQRGEDTVMNQPEFSDLDPRSRYSRFSVLDKGLGMVL